KVKTISGIGRGGVPKDCAVVVVGGPQRAWEQPDADALDVYLGAGGKALVLVGPVLDRDLRRFNKIGLEKLLEKWVARLGDNILVDPEGAHPLEGPSVWATDGYTEHASVKKLSGHVTFWPQAREVRAAGGGAIDAQELVRTSAKGWGESNLAVFRRE